jgi:nitrate/nitrite transport system substrate-binding protein
MGDDVDIAATADAVYRPDLFREAAADLGMATPADDLKPEGMHAQPWSAAAAGSGAVTLGADLFCDGRPFDPTRIDAYLAGFGIDRPAKDLTQGSEAARTPLREASTS